MIIAAKNNSRSLCFDTMRVFACLMVVFFHMTSEVLESPAFTLAASDACRAAVLFFYLAVSHFGVPFFLFISGHYLLNREDDLIAFYKKRLPRIIAALVFWSGFYVVAEHFYLRFSKGEITSIPEKLSHFFEYPLAYHLWYLHVFIFLLLLTPFIQRVVKRVPVSYVLLPLTLWWIFELAIPFLSSFTDSVRLGFVDTPSMVHGGYFVLGAYLAKIKDHRAVTNLRAWMVIGFILLVQTALATSAYMDNQAGGKVEVDYSALTYLSPLTPLSSIALFLLFLRAEKTFEKTSALTQRLIHFIAANSFTIYLCHLMPLRLYVDGYIGNKQALFQTPACDILVGTMIVFLISLGLAAALSCLLPRKGWASLSSR